MNTTTPSRRSVWTFSRADRWWLAAFLGLVVLVQLVLRVGAPLWRWSRGEPLALTVTGAVAVPSLEGRGVGHGEGTFQALLADPSAGQRLSELVPGLLAVGLVGWGAWLVLAVMRSVATGDPFAGTTARRLRLLAGVLVIGVPALTLLEVAVDALVLGTSDLSGAGVGVWVDAPWEAVVGGLVVALLAEAFVVGHRLREDVEGLV